MEEEKNNNGIEKLGEVLHNKSPLPSLRSYQGDVAKFIKEKNESVISVAVKEKQKKEKEEKEQKEKTKAKEEEGPKKGKGVGVNTTILISSILLVGAGVLAISYVFQFLKQTPKISTTTQTTIVPHNNSVNLSNITANTLRAEILNVNTENGISYIKISSDKGEDFEKISDFINFLKISPPASLMRILDNNYMVGAVNNGARVSPFMVLTIKDFAVAFASMLDWESDMEEELSFISGVAKNGTTTSAAETGNYKWKDLIIKNKDTRALSNEKGQIRIIYTFLDKKTLLITDDSKALEGVYSAYISRSFAR